MAMLNNQMVILGLYDIDILIFLILGLGVLYIYITPMVNGKLNVVGVIGIILFFLGTTSYMRIILRLGDVILIL